MLNHVLKRYFLQLQQLQLDARETIVFPLPSQDDIDCRSMHVTVVNLVAQDREFAEKQFDCTLLGMLIVPVSLRLLLMLSEAADPKWLLKHFVESSR